MVGYDYVCNMILVCLFFIHFLADYTPLSNKNMLMAKRFGEPIFPIFQHAFVHAIMMFTFLITYSIFYKKFDMINSVIIVSLIQLFSHFIIDLGKGKLNKYFPVFRDPINWQHWVLFGFDQFLHTIIILLMFSML